jgi:hypothetical protein
MEATLNRSRDSAVEVKISTEALCEAIPCNTSGPQRRFTGIYARMTGRRQHKTLRHIPENILGYQPITTCRKPLTKSQAAWAPSQILRKWKGTRRKRRIVVLLQKRNRWEDHRNDLRNIHVTRLLFRCWKETITRLEV